MIKISPIKRKILDIPKLSKKTRDKIKGVPIEVIANIYVQPEGLKKTLNLIFPEYEWIQDTVLYPRDWICNKNKKSIFDRKFFHTPAILNPPYAEVYQSKNSPRSKDEKPLKYHIAHILKVARDSQMPTAILLPRRSHRPWFNKLVRQPDVVTIYLDTELRFKNMEDKLMPPAKFKSIISVVGFENRSIHIKNDSTGCILSGPQNDTICGSVPGYHRERGSSYASDQSAK